MQLYRNDHITIDNVDVQTAQAQWRQIYTQLTNARNNGDDSGFDEKAQKYSFVAYKEWLSWVTYQKACWLVCLNKIDCIDKLFCFKILTFDVNLICIDRDVGVAMRQNNNTTKKDKALLNQMISDTIERHGDNTNWTYCHIHQQIGDAWPWRTVKNRYNSECNICLNNVKTALNQPIVGIYKLS